MKIEQSKVVSFFYTLTEENGDQLEAKDAIPMAYLHGHNNLLPSLEEALEGREAGETLRVVLPPERGFGIRKADSVQRVPVKHLMTKSKKLLPGTVVKVRTESGPLSGTIVKTGKYMANVDLNHPFAGKTLVFDIKIDTVRDATAEELNHGHAHGVGGHHH